eukprot:Em0006g854a
MAGKSTRDKDLEALRRTISDLEASMDRVNDRLDEMDEKLKERSAVESEHASNVIRVVNVIKKQFLCTEISVATSSKVVVPLKILQVVFEEYAEQLDKSLKETPWSGIDEDQNSRILQSVESHLQLYCISFQCLQIKVARDKAVQEVIQKGELNAGDAEAIKAFRCTVRNAGAVSPVVSSDVDEAVAQNNIRRTLQALELLVSNKVNGW